MEVQRYSSWTSVNKMLQTSEELLATKESWAGSQKQMSSLDTRSVFRCPNYLTGGKSLPAFVAQQSLSTEQHQRCAQPFRLLRCV